MIDENDVPPIFNVVPRPIRLDDTSPVGMVITKLEATDSDGSSPFNKVINLNIYMLPRILLVLHIIQL